MRGSRLAHALVALVGALSYPGEAGAGRVPPAGQVDHRVREVDFDPNGVVQLTGFYGYHITIQFHRAEKVVNTSAGFASAWEVTNHGSFITVKPRERSPETNFVVVTDRRTYVFDLRAKMPVTGRPPAAYATDVDQVFLLRFRYPQDERLAQDAARASMDAQSSAEAARKRRAGEIAQLPAKPRNTQYFYEGPAALAPYEAWDDGTFTYLRFYAQVDLPTPFVVNEDGSESTANKHFERDVMVIERVARRFVLRKGTTVVCLYNEGPLAQSPQPDTGSTERGGRRVIR